MAKQQIHIRASALTVCQIDELAERWGTNKTDIVSRAVDRLYQEETAMVKQCPHCGRSFDTRLVDIDRHIESCKIHGQDVVRRNLEHIARGENPRRNG